MTTMAQIPLDVVIHACEAYINQNWKGDSNRIVVKNLKHMCEVSKLHSNNKFIWLSLDEFSLLSNHIV